MNAADDLALLARVIGGLVVVLVLVATAARAARRARGFGSGQNLRVLERAGLSREAYVAVVEAGGRSLLLGVTPQGVSLLAPLDVPAGRRDPVHVVLETARSAAERASGPAAGVDPGTASGTTAGTVAGTAPGAAAGTAVPPVSGRPVALPPGVDMSGHPDLASALRAAGRTTGDGGQAQPGATPRPAQSAPLPRRAELRAGRAARVPRQRQASGSVLSPATWRQGIDALRDITVRRG